MDVNKKSDHVSVIVQNYINVKDDILSSNIQFGSIFLNWGKGTIR